MTPKKQTVERNSPAEAGKGPAHRTNFGTYKRRHLMKLDRWRTKKMLAQLLTESDRNQFRCPQPGTILMGYPPLLLLMELPQWLPIPAVDNPG